MDLQLTTKTSVNRLRTTLREVREKVQSQLSDLPDSDAGRYRWLKGYDVELGRLLEGPTKGGRLTVKPLAVRLAEAAPTSEVYREATAETAEDLRTAIGRAGILAWVSGRIPHASVVAHLKRSRVGLNAFKAGGNVAYSYKLNDYLLSGVPVVNSLPGESADLLAGNGIGINYRAGDPLSLLAALRAARLHWEANPEWGSEVLAFSRRHLDRRTSYDELLRSCLSVHSA